MKSSAKNLGTRPQRRPTAWRGRARCPGRGRPPPGRCPNAGPNRLGERDGMARMARGEPGWLDDKCDFNGPDGWFMNYSAMSLTNV